LSKHELILGDCLEELKKISDKSVDIVLTDPPYGTTDCKWDSIIPFDLMWKELKRIIKDNGCIALFGTEPFSSYLRTSNIKCFKYDWIWNKKNIGNPLIAKYQPLRQHELISVFYNKRSKYFPIKTDLDKTRTATQYNKSKLFEKGNSQKGFTKTVKGKFPKTIIEFSNAKRKKLHPTQKPVALLEYLIKTYTNENDTVLDFTMGSGSTGVAAKNLNRKFIGIEKNQNYFNIAKDRIEGVLI
tara:strand:- start:28 stop:753 length:726 start_codon:yes stop_codon:yes gene_type:complete